MAELRKPVPVPENIELTKPFWEAAKRHELMMQRCKKCAEWIFYPREQCPNCFSQDMEFQKVSGRGRVYAYTTVYQPAHPAFNDEAPYVFAIVQLDEGVRVATNIVGVPHEQVKVDMAVEAAYEDVSPEWTLVKFKPA
ncbi:MAG TPA: Zn-ribbon domain-containing OB-fold protein [Dehalococcoidia bacterium]|nr:Zn-ribbon domain-containing OB-fold protein [Dehalococcoidia bacterium]